MTTQEDLIRQVQRIESLEISRTQAAAELGITLSALNGLLRRGNFTERLKVAGSHAKSLARKWHDPDKANAYLQAIEYAKVHGSAKAAREFNVNFQVLCRKVRALST